MMTALSTRCSSFTDLGNQVDASDVCRVFCLTAGVQRTHKISDHFSRVPSAFVQEAVGKMQDLAVDLDDLVDNVAWEADSKSYKVDWERWGVYMVIAERDGCPIEYTDNGTELEPEPSELPAGVTYSNRGPLVWWLQHLSGARARIPAMVPVNKDWRLVNNYSEEDAVLTDPDDLISPKCKTIFKKAGVELIAPEPVPDTKLATDTSTAEEPALPMTPSSPRPTARLRAKTPAMPSGTAPVCTPPPKRTVIIDVNGLEPEEKERSPKQPRCFLGTPPPVPPPPRR